MKDREEMRHIHGLIEALRDYDDDCLIVAVGARGPNLDMPEGNAIVTIRMGNDEATAEAKYLDDAAALARAKIIREREAREAAKKKEKAA